MDTPSRRGRRSGCPISTALEILGDAWSLLVVRDLMFKGYRTFNEFLNAGEGIATNVLAERLQRLESAGILVRRRDPRDGRRWIYRLTEKGIDLAPALVEVVLWAADYEDTDAPESTIRAMRADREGFLAALREGWLRKGGDQEVLG
jgi:DNA-binding HxlR family transcriptional regulator